jgi:hypothetical protein
MKTHRFITLVLVLLFLSSFGWAQDSELYKFLVAIPGAEVKKVDSSAFKEFYVLMLPQLVDHNNKSGAQFKQRIYVGHQGFDRPTVMETEGYSAGNINGFVQSEPTRILNANQLYVEHRYFGASAPTPLEWKYLTAEQDAGDYHYIRTLFGQIYKGKWVATGVSKGGQTATEYKVYYPEDVDVTIPYVAPINYKRLDKRIDLHFEKVGTPECRKHIRDLQDYWMKNKKELLPMYNDFCTKAGFKFDLMPAEEAYDYSVLEFPFSFWQYHANCDRLPDLSTTTPDKMVKYLARIVSPYWYTDAVEAFSPANYQFYTQLGYYEYNEKPFRKYLKNKDYPNSAFVPKGVEIKWDNTYIKKLKKFIRSEPQHMIYIYGEADPWGATAAKIKPGAGSLKEVQKGGTHGAHIGSLSPDQKKEVYKALSQWLGMELEVPAN